MASSFDDIFSLQPGRITVPVGATLAVFVDVISGEKALLLKYVSGGTLEILSVTSGASTFYGGSGFFIAGSTQTPAMLAAMSGTGYVFTAGEVLSIDGPCRMYLSSTGATTIVHTLQGKAQGT